MATTLWNSENLLEFVKLFRGVETPCDRCRGFGCYTYGSTSTWRGGMGGASMTSDVCDSCWGSGDAQRSWTNLRKLLAEEDTRVHSRAAELLARRCGVGLTVLRTGLVELCDELDKFERQRRARPEGFRTVARCLSHVLRDMIESA